MTVAGHYRVRVTTGHREIGSPRIEQPLHIILSHGSSICSRNFPSSIAAHTQPNPPLVRHYSLGAFWYRHTVFFLSFSMQLYFRSPFLRVPHGGLCSRICITICTPCISSPFPPGSGDRSCRCLFVFVSIVAHHDVDVRVEWHPFKCLPCPQCFPSARYT